MYSRARDGPVPTDRRRRSGPVRARAGTCVLVAARAALRAVRSGDRMAVGDAPYVLILGGEYVGMISLNFP